MHKLDTLSIGRPIARGPITLYPLYDPSRVPTHYLQDRSPRQPALFASRRQMAATCQPSR